MAFRIDRLGLRVQEVLAQAMGPLTYGALTAWMRFARAYRIPDLQRVREEFRAQAGTQPGPLLVCANHLTLIDSLVIQWALASNWRFTSRRDVFVWNLPDRRNLAAFWWWRVLGYFGKCIPVVRNGTPDQARQTLDKVRWLLARGQSVVIFPEGGRSRVGRVDRQSVTYGVGQILQAAPGTRVLCVFLRGRGQHVYSDYPAKGETFVVRLKSIAPISASAGMRGARDVALQIVGQLSEMETRYFDDTGVDR
ncbi:MAG: lysophospholipid acyltransferase family protein [Acidobacteriota bacterium]